MNTDMNTVRLLGAAQLVVFLASMLSERLLASVVGSGSASDTLVNISKNLTRLRISNLVALANSLAILVLGVLFYVVFSQEYRPIALVALVCFAAEAITLAVSKIGTFALVPLSQEFVAVGAPDSSHFQTLGDFLYHGIDRRGYDLHMLFFCAGGILWYSLLVVSGVVPRALAIWGLAAISLLTIPMVLVLYKRDLTAAMLLALPYFPFEPVLGAWLLIRGFN
jgi:hypothetical protein